MKRLKYLTKYFGYTTRKLKDQAGQTATEYMLIIAVVVLGAVAGASILLPEFRGAVTELAGKITSIMSTSEDAAEGIIGGNVGP